MEIGFIDPQAGIQKELQISQIHNLAPQYFIKNGTQLRPFKKSDNRCGKFPYLYDIKFSNTHWQVMETRMVQFFLYSAYYDVRKANNHGASVRILAMTKALKPTVKICQLWFKGQYFPVESEVVEFVNGGEDLDKQNEALDETNNGVNLLNPFLLECPIPEQYKDQVPLSVSLVHKRCDKATNNLKVQYNLPTRKEPKKKFALCMKAITIPEDESEEILEWIEIVRAYGVEKIYFYVLEAHKNILKVKNLSIMI